MGRNKLLTENVLTRVDEVFNAELEEIKDIREEQGLDKVRLSTRELTELITKHNSWSLIKQDLLNINLNKKNNE